MTEGCPVKHSSSNSAPKSSSVLDSPKPNCSNGQCSVKEESTYNPLVGDEVFNQDKQPNQNVLLSTTRAVSTIPKSKDFSPHHQVENVDKWVYPSEQQYFNAMKRKGYNPSEMDIPAALYVHNHVNEEGWRRVKEWELMRGNQGPILRRFLGRPKDLSPKARFLGFLGYELPFDRHDWYIERDGKEVRYVIDFYRGKSIRRSPISMYLDVRPALDSPSAFVDIFGYYFRSKFAPWLLPKSSFTKRNDSAK